MREITYEGATQEAIQEEFRRDPKTVHLSTDLYAELQNEFGAERIRVTPIAENSFVGAAIGLAGSGFRTVVNIRMATFGFVAMDQMINHAAKIHYMFGGQAKFPILYRMTVGAGISAAAQHSVSPYPMYMNAPGLKIILPSTPYDAKGLFKTALRDMNPVVSFEHVALGGMRGEVPQEEYFVPFGHASVRREGSDVTVVALAKMVHEALEAARELAEEDISVEVIDPRTLVPLDRGTIFESVRKTGRLVVVDEACQTCGAAAEIVALVTSDAAVFGRLKAAPARVCGLDVPIPFSPPMEKFAVPDKVKIVEAVRGVLESRSVPS
ncbi:MAG: alpha-ketoacid dehydrogenase subunit beta [Actinobacteria bacterium]|jgi:pyruvate/2-oxoglutarate/acetoin dehydrogenase E1 component|nr:alpha-ketoacid dehydrogenase subunit beta [Actinomycetota bacterium]